MLLNYFFTALGSGSVPTYSRWFTRVDSDEEAEGGLVVIQRAKTVETATNVSSAEEDLHGIQYNTIVCNFFIWIVCSQIFFRLWG